MHFTRRLLAANPRTPLIKFLGKRSPHQTESPAPTSPPHPHPASPSPSLPDSFIAYRSKAQQHGPLGGHNRTAAPVSPSASPLAYGAVGGHSGHGFGALGPQKGEVWDRSELPERFGRMKWSVEEIEAVEMGGAGVGVGWGGS